MAPSAGSPTRRAFPPHVALEALEARRMLSSSWSAAAGLAGEYFNGTHFNGKSVTQTDAEVDFDFGDSAPVDGLGAHGYSVRWSGLIDPTASERYTFAVRFEGQARLWVDGRQLIDRRDDSADVTENGRIKLKAGRSYDLRLEFTSRSGDADVRLSWQSASMAGGQQVIPASALRPYDQRFAIVGDYGINSTEEADVARMIHAWDPDFIITTGDNDYVGSLDDGAGRYYHQYIRKYSGDHGEGAHGVNRFFPALGNHDWDHGIDAYTSFFALLDNERYYDFVRGPVHFFAIDSDGREPDGNTANSEQARWLRHAMDRSTSRWNVVYFHHPAYSSGEDGSNNYMRWPFADWGADAVIAGHEHNYERLKVDGLTYFVNGLGGAHKTEFGSLLAQSQARFDEDFGAMLVQATDDTINFQFITRQGEVIDSATHRHRRAANTMTTSATALRLSGVTTDLFSSSAFGNFHRDEDADSQAADELLRALPESDPDAVRPRENPPPDRAGRARLM